MSSSVNRRRPKRRQPHRNCKRLRYEKGYEPRLLGLPDELLLYTLEFVVLSKDEFATEIWKWLGQLARVCRIFRQLARELMPHLFIARFEEVQTRTDMLTSLVRSFARNPWKTARLKVFFYEGYRRILHIRDNHLFLEALLALVESPGALVNVEQLHLRISNDEGIFDAYFLYAVAQNLPCLSELNLRGALRGFVLGRRVTPDQFWTFSEMLQKPLKRLELSCFEIRNDQLHSLLRRHGPSLTFLNLDCNSSDRTHGVSDSTLAFISENCSQLEELRIGWSNITSIGLESILRTNSRIDTLGLLDCSSLVPESINVLIQHAPQLQSLQVIHCRWFTDDCLDRLVQGQIDYWTRAGETEIPLVEVRAFRSRVTQAGVRRVVAKPHAGLLSVRLGDN